MSFTTVRITHVVTFLPFRPKTPCWYHYRKMEKPLRSMNLSSHTLVGQLDHVDSISHIVDPNVC